MKHKFLLLLAAAMFFCGCEKNYVDDRQKNHEDGHDGLVALLGIEVVSLPYDSMYLTCDFGNHHFAPTEAIKTPYYFRIVGGYFIGNNNPNVVILGSVDRGATMDTLLNAEVVQKYMLKELGYPSDLAVVGNNGFIGKYLFWYE